MPSNDCCEREQLVAYIDGELDVPAVTIFEQHIEGCEPCRFELRAQRMFLCDLDAAMSGGPEIPAPSNFAKIVAAHAETDMRGVRSLTENKRALRFIVILALAAFSLLGASAIKGVFGTVRAFIGSVFGLVGFVGKTTYDTAASAVVISKVVSRRFVIESGLLGLLVVLLFLAVLLLSRLIASYHRARATE